MAIYLGQYTNISMLLLIIDYKIIDKDILEVSLWFILIGQNLFTLKNLVNGFYQ